MSGADARLPLQVAAFEGHPEYRGLDECPGFRQSPPLIGRDSGDGEAAARQSLGQPLSHEPEKRFPRDGR